ncbi:MAG: flavodoxin-dependent (E)-4-hydroxy-3-methylbut-2-enyl-diphosphate synthase [Thermodesulfovibrionales bacterium]
MIKRKKTRIIDVGGIKIGGGNPVVVQSMTKTDTKDIGATVRQIKKLSSEGCEIVRIAVPDMEAAEAIGEIKTRVSNIKLQIPIIADIHFDWRLALRAIKNGVDGLRINPGNIGARWKVAEVVSACKDKGIPIRIGVNAGSLSKKILSKYHHPLPEALVESAEEHIDILEGMNFRDIKVSLKASNVMTTVEAYRLFSKRHRYPLHVGISEAGPFFTGVIKSSIGIGLLLEEGIGDTIRVSLSTDPVEEVRVAYEILKSLGMRQKGVNLISCPTCGRCGIDIRGLAERAEERLKEIDKPMTVAIMGCAVNGPGEAREADIGIAGGKGFGILFKKGKVIKKVREEDMLETLMSAVRDEAS